MGRKKFKVDANDLWKDLSGKVYIVTGSNWGVGLETARQLVKQGCHVVLACRRVDAADKVAESFSKLDGAYEVMKVDLAELQSVRDFVGEFKSKHRALDGLVYNAGIGNSEPGR